MGNSTAAVYIHLVQRLIEECMIFKMSKEECMEALSKHSNIQPIITATVWKELEKENMEFFEKYMKDITTTTSNGGTTYVQEGNCLNLDSKKLH